MMHIIASLITSADHCIGGALVRHETMLIALRECGNVRPDYTGQLMQGLQLKLSDQVTPVAM